MTKTDDKPAPGYAEGDVCARSGCTGIIASHAVKDCYCHICAPCSNCTAPRNFCPECDWHEANDPLVIMGAVAYYLPEGFVQRKKRVLDPTKIDYRIEQHSNSSQLCIGVYPEGTTSQEIEAIVKGTFGGRFNKFRNGEFEYVAYTD